MKMLLTALFFILFTAWDAEAQIFKLTRVTDAGAAANAVIDAELVNVQADINQDLPLGKPKRLMEGMANSQVASAKGVATDYISHFDAVAIGVGVGIGADLEEDKSVDSELSGAGITGAVQFGLNVSKITDSPFLGMDPKRLTVMGNFFKYNADRKVDDNAIKADMLSFGFSGSYRWIDGGRNRWWGWDGVRLHTGYQYSRLDLTVSTNLNEVVNANLGANGTLNGTVSGSPKATIETGTHSIPLEISTGVNFLYVLSFYGGLGTDINMGAAKGKGALNSDDSTLTCSGGTSCGGNPNIVVRTSANVGEEGKVNPFFLRAFAGFQVNVPFVNIYAQANKVFGTEVYNFATGVRLVF